MIPFQKKQKNTSVLCIGSMGKDIFLPTDDGEIATATGEIETQKQWAFGYGSKVYVEDRMQALGGCACNVSIGLAKLGQSASAYGIIGDDADGKWITESLVNYGVNTKPVSTISKRVSDLSVVLVHAQEGERTIFVNRDIGEELKLSAECFDDSSWVFVGSLYGEYICDNMRVIHDVVTRGKCKLIYNPGMRNIKNEPQTVWDLIHHSNLLFVNKVEARQIIETIVSQGKTQYNEKELEDECRLVEILSEQISTSEEELIIVLTCGPRGAWVLHQGEISHVGTKEKDIVDTTGAGDAFASGFTAAHLAGESHSVCMQWGAANSHGVIGEFGGQVGLLDTDKISDLAGEFTPQKLKKCI